MPLLPIRPGQRKTPHLSPIVGSADKEIAYLEGAKRSIEKQWDSVGQSAREISSTAAELAYGEQKLDIANTLDGLQKNLLDANTFKEAQEAQKKIDEYTAKLSESSEGLPGLVGNLASRESLSRAQSLQNTGMAHVKATGIEEANAQRTVLSQKSEQIALESLDAISNIPVQQDQLNSLLRVMADLRASQGQAANSELRILEGLNSAPSESAIALESNQLDVDSTKFVLENAPPQAILSLLNLGPEGTPIPWDEDELLDDVVSGVSSFDMRRDFIENKLVPLVGSQYLSDLYAKSDQKVNAQIKLDFEQRKQELFSAVMEATKGRPTPLYTQTARNLAFRLGRTPSGAEVIKSLGTQEDFGSHFENPNGINWQNWPTDEVHRLLKQEEQASSKDQQTAIYMAALAREIDDGTSSKESDLGMNIVTDSFYDFENFSEQAAMDLFGIPGNTPGDIPKGPALLQATLGRMYANGAPITQHAIEKAKKAVYSDHPDEALLGAMHLIAIRKSPNFASYASTGNAEKFSKELERAKQLINTIGDPQAFADLTLTRAPEPLSQKQMEDLSDEVSSFLNPVEPNVESLSNEVAKQSTQFDSRPGARFLGAVPEWKDRIIWRVENAINALKVGGRHLELALHHSREFFNLIPGYDDLIEEDIILTEDQIEDQIREFTDIQQKIKIADGPDPDEITENPDYIKEAKAIAERIISSAGSSDFDETTVVEKVSDEMYKRGWALDFNTRDQTWSHSIASTARNPSFINSISSNLNSIDLRLQIVEALNNNEAFIQMDPFTLANTHIVPVSPIFQTTHQGLPVYLVERKDEETGTWSFLMDRSTNDIARFLPNGAFTPEQIAKQNKAIKLANDLSMAYGHGNVIDKETLTTYEDYKVALEAPLETITEDVWEAAIGPFLTNIVRNPNRSAFEKYIDDTGQNEINKHLPFVMDGLWYSAHRQMAYLQQGQTEGKVAEFYLPKTIPQFADFIRRIFPRAAEMNGEELTDTQIFNRFREHEENLRRKIGEFNPEDHWGLGKAPDINDPTN